jgi:predicted Rossmann fold nucleotide-binding protein DprA/Smf involved in DNA uptake
MAQKIIVFSPDDNRYPKSRLTTWFNPLPPLHAIGNLDLLNLPLTALFCSRKCPGDAILKAYDLARDLRDKETPVISGFHTPVEKDMLDILFKGKVPVVVCPARGLEGMRIPIKMRKPLSENRLLFVSGFSGQEKRVTKKTAVERNRLVAALAIDRKFIHIDSGGSLESLYTTLYKTKVYQVFMGE